MGGGRRERVALMAMAAAFAIVIAPDLLYRANVLGSVFAVESPESAQMVWLDAPRQFLEMLRALFSVTGFGPLFLFVPLGWWFLWRAKNEFAVWVLAAWLLAFMLLHAPLRLTGVFENSLRYVLPAYPALALSASAAAILLLEAAWQAVRASRTRLAKQSLLAYAIALSGIIALAIALRAFVAPERFAARAYGWMSAETRRDFESLNTQLPPDAVIGVPDQIAGAAILYGQRDVFRPGNFVEPVREVSAFLEKMKSENRAVYFLGDWNCAADAPLSERLPQWLENYTGGEVQGEVRGLPFGCAFPLRQMR